MHEKAEFMLTSLQAYKVMFTFLDHYYDQTLSRDLGELLSGLALLEDGISMDASAWHDWITITSDLNGDILTSSKTFTCMIKFLEDYSEQRPSEDISHLLNIFKEALKQDLTSSVWRNWHTAVNKILSDKKQYGYFELLSLTNEEAFNAMILFLKKYHEETQSPDIKSLLDTIFFKNTASSIAWQTWITVLQEKKFEHNNQVNNQLLVLHAFKAAVEFLEKYYKQTLSQTVGTLIKKMNSFLENNDADQIVWNRWLESVDMVLNPESTIHLTE